MVSCELGGIAQESSMMGDGEGIRSLQKSNVTHQVVLGQTGKLKMCAGFLVQWLTKHPTQSTHRSLLLTANR